jgi:hypothetical protein
MVVRGAATTRVVPAARTTTVVARTAGVTTADRLGTQTEDASPLAM